MIVGAFAAAGVHVAREWILRMTGGAGKELFANRGGVVAVTGVLPSRVDQASRVVVEGAAYDDAFDIARVARSGLVCGIGLDDDGLAFARGRFGGRSLFYATLEAGAVIIGASSFDALVKACGQATLRRDRLVSLLAVLPESDLERTAYEEIVRLRSREVVRVSLRGAVRQIVDQPSPRMLKGKPDELAEELRRVIMDAVGRSVKGAKRVAVSVSGGLDSSGLLVAAAALARGADRTALDALTIAFDDPGDDRPYVRALCDELGIAPIRLSPSTLGAKMRETLVLDGAPATAPNAGWMLSLVETARAAGAERLLTGDGGDLVFEGDLSAIAARGARGRVLSSLKGALAIDLPSTPTRVSKIMELVVKPVLRRRTPSFVRAKWQSRAFARRFPWLTSSACRWAARTLRDIAPIDRYETRTDASWLEGAGASRLLEYGDSRTQLENTCDGLWQSPYLDVELVDFVRSIPGEAMFHGGWSRGLYREAFRGLMPERNRLRRTKSGVAQGIREGIAGAGGLGAFGDLLRLDKLRAFDLVDQSSHRAHLRAAMAGGVPNWHALWAPVAVEAYLGGLGA